MRKWKEQELAQWLEARLEGTLVRRDQRLLVASSLARQLLESPEITIRFHSAARIQRKGPHRRTRTREKP